MSGLRDRLTGRLGVSGAVLLAAVLASVAIGALSSLVPALAIAGVLAAGLLVAALASPLTSIALLLAIGGLPLEGLTGGEKSLFQGFGGASVSGIILIAMVAVLLLVFVSGRVPLRVSLVDGALLLMLAVAAVSIVHAPAPLEGVRVFTKILYPVLIFLAVRSYLGGERQRDYVMRFIIAGGLAVSAWALWGLFTDGLPVYLSGTAYRMTVATTHPTPFGFYMVTLFALCYPRWRHDRTWGIAALSALFGLQAVLSMSRMAILGVALVIILTEVALTRRPTRWLRAGVVAVLLVGAGVSVVLSTPSLQEGVFYSPQSLSSDPTELFESLNDQGRGAVRDAMIADTTRAGTWLLGQGLGASTVALDSGALGDLGGVGVAHDEYLRLVYETGLVGLVVAVIAMLAVVVTAWRTSQALPERDRWIGVAAFSLSVCYMLFAATDNVFDYYNTFSQYGYFALGAAMALATAPGSPQEADAAEPTAEATATVSGHERSVS